MHIRGFPINLRVEVVRRLVDPPAVAAAAKGLFGVVWLLGNAIATAIPTRARSENLNLRAAYLDHSTIQFEAASHVEHEPAAHDCGAG